MPVADKPVKKKRGYDSGTPKMGDSDAAGPRYIAMADDLRKRILAGELQPGDRLPSFTEMRNQHGSTVATVERIYGVLEKEGLVERRHGVGTFVTKPQVAATGNIGFLGGAFQKRHRQIYHANLMDGVQAALDEYDQHLLHMGSDQRWSRAALDKVDGVLLGNVGGAASVISEFPVGLPSVALLTAVNGITSVVADDYGGTQQAIRHLLELGHRRIACVMEKQPPVARLRIAAYNDALLDAGVTPDPRWLCPSEDITYLASHMRPTYMAWGHDSMQAWLRSGWAESGCTAIFVQNDMAGAGVIQALHEAGLKVPEDVSVVGFDGTEVCDFCNPRLTAVEVPLTKIGAKAVELLLRQIETGEQDAHSVVMPTRIREGESTGPPPGHQL